MLQHVRAGDRRSYWRLALVFCVLAAVLVVFPAPSQAQATEDDLAAVFSAWGVHQAGFTVTFQNGPRGFWRLFCWFGCLSYQETPPDFRTWDWGRTLYWADDITQTARLPGQPVDCQLSGFARSGSTIFGRCVIPGGNSMFQPSVAPGAWRAYLAALTPPASAKVIP